MINRNLILNRVLPLAILLVLVFGALAAYLTLSSRQEAEAAWYNPGTGSWPYRKSITIPAQTSLSGGLSNFPMLFSQTDPELRPSVSGGNSGGTDLVFVDWEGNKLADEIEKFSDSTGEAVIWVKVPYVSSTSTREVYLYYGNGGVADQQNKTGVWDANYKGVWHLNQTLTGAGQSVADSKGNANGSSVGTWSSGQQAPGAIGGSLNFNGTDDRIDMSDSPMDISSSALTMSAWVYDAGAADAPSGYLLGKVVGSWNYSLGIDQPGQRINITLNTTGNASQYNYVGGGVGHLDFMHGKWNNVTVVYDNTTPVVYVNGVVRAITLPAPQSGTIIPNNDVFAIGDRGAWPNTRFKGIMDEVRVSSSARSADWIKTEYANQNSPGTFYNYGGQETPPDTTPPTVSLTAPTTGAAVAGPAVSVAASAADNVGVVGVQFKLDNTNLGAEDVVAPYTIAWDTTLVADGNHTLVAVARDAAGNHTTSAAVSAAVDNVPDLTINASAKTTVTNGLVGYWTFDGPDIAGTTATDRSGAGHGGTISGAKTQLGKSGQALSFDGSDSRITAASDFIGSGALTVCAWLNPSGRGQNNLGTVIGNGRFIFGTVSSVWGVTSDAYVTIAQSAPGSFVLNTWQHVCAIRPSGGSGGRVYVNGSLSGSESQNTGTPAAGTYNVTVGDDGSGGLNFAGLIDDVRIYNRTLSPAEVKQLYRAGEVVINHNQNTRLTDGLVGLWSFNGPDVEGTTAYDRSGQGNSGTISGATATIGKVGQALSFDGSDDVVSLSRDFVATGDRTTCAWAYLTSEMGDGTNERIFDSVYYHMGYFTVSGIYYVLLTSNDNNAVLYTLPSNPVGVWNYICGVRPGSAGVNAAIYVNGLNVQTGNDGNPSSAFNLSIGGTASHRFKGYIDEARIYNRLLSDSEIKQLYDMGK